MKLNHKNQGVGMNGMVIGDIVEISDVQLNWWGIKYKNNSAYNGYRGKVIDIWEDKSFSLFNGSSRLIVPAFGPKESSHIGIKINGEFYFYYFNKDKSRRTYYRRIKSFFRKLILPLFYQIV